jgi:4-carboxymuconolactone decarboxylase
MRSRLQRKGVTVTDCLPEVYQQFSSRFPAVKESFDALGAAEHDTGPLGEKERRLVKLGVSLARKGR